MLDELVTFNGERILYDNATHEYMTPDGRHMESATAFAERMTPKFDADRVAGFVAKKYKLEKKTVLDMWEHKGEFARTYGTALHLAMEQWFKFRGCGTPKRYELPSASWFRAAVQEFPLKDAYVVTEQAVASCRMLRAGRVDGLHKVDRKSFNIIDFKTDGNVEKNVDKHTYQLNFYRSVLEDSGFTVPQMTIWAWDGVWTPVPIKKISV